MFEAIAESSNPLRYTKFKILASGRLLDWADVLSLWQDDPEFADFFIGLFARTGYAEFRFETPPLSTASLHQPFEFVILNAPGARRTPDAETFAEFFDAGADPHGIVVFENLSRDALLIVPSPLAADADYCGLAEFFHNAPRRSSARCGRSRPRRRARWFRTGLSGSPSPEPALPGCTSASTLTQNTIATRPTRS